MSSTSPWVRGLNDAQAEAALHNNGPLLILAGAGSGKTTVLVARTGRLIDEGVARPDEILVLTFTNKAARELKERVASKIGRKGKDIWAGTFHSFGLSILRDHHEQAGLPKRFAIVDSTDARAIVKDLLKDHTHGDKDAFDPEVLLGLMAKKREGRKMPVDAHPADVEMVEMILPKYLARLKMLGAVDFDGLLLEPLILFKKFPEILEKYQKAFKQVMVDEFQDTNRVQMKLIGRLVDAHKNISVVGDDDQSIYGWRGAVISNILNFPKRFENCVVVRLEMNYRSTSKILDVANSVIVKNKARHDKQLRPHKVTDEEGLPEVFTYDTDEEEIEEVISQIRHFESKGYKLDEIAILFRSNSQGGLLEGTLRKNNIEYSLSGGSGLFDRKEVRDVLAYIRSAMAPNDLSVRRILNTPTRGLGKVTYGLVDEHAKTQKISFYKALKDWENIEGLPENMGKRVQGFLDTLDSLRQFLTQTDSVDYSIRLMEFFARIGYKDYVYSSYKDTNTAYKKWQLIEIIGRILDGFIARAGRGAKTVQEFIDSMELRDQPEEEGEDGPPKLQMLTLHACKGLEFPVVIMIGIEEGLLPHETLGMDTDEERRLFYVGVTRAQKSLVLTKVRKRKRYGKWRLVSPSRFLCEVPEDLLTHFENGARPLGEDGRRSMLDSLYAKLDQKIQKNSEV